MTAINILFSFNSKSFEWSVRIFKNSNQLRNRLQFTNNCLLLRTTTQGERRWRLSIIATQFRKPAVLGYWNVSRPQLHSLVSVPGRRAKEKKQNTNPRIQHWTGALTRWPAWLIGDRQGGVEEWRRVGEMWWKVEGAQRDQCGINQRQKQKKGRGEEKEKAKTKMGHKKRRKTEIRN